MESTACSNTIGTADGVSAWSMSDDQLTTALLDNQAALHRHEARRLELIREADARNLAVSAGAANTAQWVAGVLRVPSAEAGAMVKLASHLDAELPATAQALADGQISVPHARVISRVVQLLPSHISTPELRSEVEATLLERAATFDPKVLGKVGNHLLMVVAPDLADQVLELKLKQEEASAERDRFLRMSFDETSGTWRVTARLPKVVGERLKLVLDPLAAPQPGPDGRDTRLPEQRNVDALDEACRRLLADKLVPSHGGNPTQLVVTVTNTGGRTLHTGIELSRKLVDQLMCEADRTYLVKPEHQPGRVTLLTDTQQRLFQGKLRRLLELRDGGCAFPGCDRPPGWCHAHHVVPWSKGGPTTRDNGVLLCGYHHRLIHQGAWQVRIALDGLPEFLPPDWIDPKQRPLRNHRFAPAA
ncbi:HNH endonuclease signature motif containing protein [Tenggerimyces flavus]|uniref:DUF222 domain-containing protein n=1 Tax=Tenggerimyces flavus TaxID=1708749 RepID=A0ABV7YDU7_9ACTN|nr:HNH endonuclease signature motif containing protein [Tenggerimyces flavus]MBM7789057.1 hypothetical protein [Tenggerimyces flavus]